MSALVSKEIRYDKSCSHIISMDSSGILHSYKVPEHAAHFEDPHILLTVKIECYIIRMQVINRITCLWAMIWSYEFENNVHNKCLKKDIDCILKLYEWEIYTLPVPWSGGTTVVDLTAWLMNIDSGINPDRSPLNDTPVIGYSWPICSLTF